MKKKNALGNSVKIDRNTMTLREKVLQALRNAILNFQLLPGDRLVERDLCEQLGVSRTSVREALRHLESEGLVGFIDDKGPRVASIDMQDAKEIYELRCSLECMIIELFTVRASDEQLLDLEYALRKLQSRLSDGKMLPILEAATAFYEALFDGSGNRTACNILRQQQARISFLRATSISQASRTQSSASEMEKIVSAIKTRDPKQAHDACLEHIKKAAEVAFAVLAEQEQGNNSIVEEIRASLQVDYSFDN